MTTYLSTFITGFNDIVKSELANKIKDMQIVLALDGLILYRTSATVNQVRQLRFLNNTFIVFKYIRNNSSDPLRTIAVEALKQANIEEQLLASLPHRPTSFRVKTFNENQPVAIDPKILSQLEHQLGSMQFLRLNKANAQLEFWCFTRSEGYAFYALKVTRTENYERTLQKGELRPELAHLLCLLAKPKASDIFLDPFAGHGSIPIERAKMMPAQKIIAGEEDLELVKKLNDQVKKISQPIIVKQLNALHSPFETGSVNKIVTDPPWGIYEKGLDINLLYTGMLAEFSRILRTKGTVVILTAQKDTLAEIAKAQTSLKLISEYSTLVSGKKASAYKLVKG